MLLRKYHEKGIDIRACAVPGKEDFPSMAYAAYHGNVDVIKVLHELLGAEAVNAPDKTLGRTPIFGAVQGGQSAAVRVLCELGADVNAKDNKGFTPVLFASQERFVEAIRVLVEFGADVNIQDIEGFTPVYFAASKGFVEVIRVLVEFGADVNAQDNEGVTPVYFAAQEGFVKAVRVLHEFGADLDIPTNEGATPVHVAAINGHKEVVKLLRRLGADMTAAVQHKGKQYSPADFASIKGHTATAERLTRYASQCACCEQKGADVKLQACSVCTTTYYCSTTCQKQDWKQHKQTCQPPLAEPQT